MKNIWIKCLSILFISTTIFVLISGIQKNFVFKKELKPEEVNSMRSYIVNRIEKYDAEEVYNQIKKRYRNISDAGHSIAHIFGEVLYDKFGEGGIKICDGRLGFGCFHGLIIRAISDNGTDAVSNIDKECIKKFGPMGLGCQHGIGHGILEYLGYKKLNDAYALCEKLTWQGSLLGCKGGVSMQYFFPGNSVPTTYMPDIDICNKIKPSAQKSCYYELPSALKHIHSEAYAKIEEKCASAPDKEIEHICLLGIGNVASLYEGFDIEKSIQICSDLKTQQSRFFCKSGAYWTFKDNGLNGDKICETENTLIGECHERSNMTKY